jgi:aryl-alcohol dehydrogenase-like predicted oxidoreductase
VGFGSAEIGQDWVTSEEASKVLHAVLDAGINVVDTAACYGHAEKRIGESIADRRDEYVLVTKVGHGGEELSLEEWTPELVEASVERSLVRMKTDYVDVVLLHSCDDETLDDQELLASLEACKQAGKTRTIGYSGDAVAAEKAVGMNLFDAIETSVNFVDQDCVDRYLTHARDNGLGVLAKRPIANGCWRDLDQFEGFYKDYIQPYVERREAMGLTPEAVGFGGDWAELALRFCLTQPGVDTAIVGSTNPEHIQQNVELVEKGPLPKDVNEAIRKLWHEHNDGSWLGKT